MKLYGQIGGIPASRDVRDAALASPPGDSGAIRSFAARLPSSPFRPSPPPEMAAGKARTDTGEGGGGDLGARIDLVGLRVGVSHRWPADPCAAALSARRRRPSARDVCRRRWPAYSAARVAGRWWSPAVARFSVASDLEVPLSPAAPVVVPVLCGCMLRWW